MTGDGGGGGSVWWRSEEFHGLEDRTGAAKARLGKRSRLQAAEEASRAAKVLGASDPSAPHECGEREATHAVIVELEKLYYIDRGRLRASMRHVPNES